jgi:ribonuclease P protein component, eubacterial
MVKQVTFPRELRLLTPDTFQKVFAQPVRASSPHLTLLAIRNDLTHPRLGLAIPKKALKRAVWRNRVKRQIRESFRLHQHELPPIDIVVIAKAPVRGLANPDLSQLLDKLWRTLARRSNG